MKAFVVVTTCPTKNSATKLAQQIVDKRLAACAQVSGAIQSFYRWKGKLESAQEFQIWIKTRRKQFRALEKEIIRLHPHETPQILALEIKEGHRPYLKWLAQETA